MLPLNDTLGRQHNDLYIHCSSILWRLILVFFDDFELYHLRFLFRSVGSLKIHVQQVSVCKLF
jgi:hypothetical protein